MPSISLLQSFSTGHNLPLPLPSGWTTSSTEAEGITDMFHNSFVPFHLLDQFHGLHDYFWTVRTTRLTVLMTVHHFSTQYSTNSSDKSPLLPPGKHHSSDQGCGLGLDFSVSRRLGLVSGKIVNISVSAIYVSCPRPIFGQIVQVTVCSVNRL